MPQTYGFQISMPVDTTLPRDRIANTIHMQHSIGALADTDLESMCADIGAMYAHHYLDGTKEIQVKAYDTDAKPNYPRATWIANPGVVWNSSSPREIALVLSWAAEHRGNKSERGRIYLMPQIVPGQSLMAQRPGTPVVTWALNFYTEPNQSFPDLGGVDWKFGTWSPTYQKFTQSKQAWVNDDWDVQRRRGLRENTRQTATRDG